MKTKSSEFKRMVVPMEVKEISDEGIFSGYASIFGNVDLGGDIISKDEPFKEMSKTPEGKVLVLYEHDAYGFTESGGFPIAKADVTQNSRGLKFEAELVKGDPFVDRVKTHLKAGTLAGMSIGYEILPGGAKVNDSGIRELNALKLWEISVVKWGMNPKALVERVKSFERCSSVRELESFLRDAVGLSRSKATAHASEIWKTLSGQRDAGDDEGAAATLERMTDFLRSVVK